MIRASLRLILSEWRGLPALTVPLSGLAVCIETAIFGEAARILSLTFARAGDISLCDGQCVRLVVSEKVRRAIDARHTLQSAPGGGYQ